MDRSKQLGEGHINSLLLKFSIPAIIGMIVNALYNVVDSIFIGRGVGDLGLTAVNTAFPIAIIIMAFGMLVGIGSAALISIRLGQGNKKSAEKILGNAFTLTVIISILISFFGLIFLKPALILFGSDESTLNFGMQYMRIILAGCILQNIGFGLNSIIRSEGNPKIAMLTMLIGAITNMILDPIFIFWFHLGVQGAAIATIISQGLNTIWVLYYFLGKNSVLKLKKKNMMLSKDIIRSILAIGMAPFAMQIASSIVNALFNIQLKRFSGVLAIGAMGIIMKITMFILMPIFGINQGSQPIIGYNYGAEKYDRVKHTLKSAIGIASIIAITGFVLIEAFPKYLIQIFVNSDSKLLPIGSVGIRIFLCMLPIIGFQIVSSNYFQAIGKAKTAIFLSLSRQVIILIPALLILPHFLGVTGVWICAPVSDFLASILTAVFIFKDIKRISNLNKKSSAVAE